MKKEKLVTICKKDLIISERLKFTKGNIYRAEALEPSLMQSARSESTYILNTHKKGSNKNRTCVMTKKMFMVYFKIFA